MSTVKKLEQMGHEKLYGDNSLTAGELVFTVLAAAVMYYGIFVTGSKLTKRQAILLGLALLVFGEAVF